MKDDHNLEKRITTLIDENALAYKRNHIRDVVLSIEYDVAVKGLEISQAIRNVNIDEEQADVLLEVRYYPSHYIAQNE